MNNRFKQGCLQEQEMRQSIIAMTHQQLYRVYLMHFRYLQLPNYFHSREIRIVKDNC